MVGAMRKPLLLPALLLAPLFALAQHPPQPNVVQFQSPPIVNLGTAPVLYVRAEDGGFLPVQGQVVVSQLPAVQLVDTADGGTLQVHGEVSIPGRVEVSATTPPGTWLAVAGSSEGGKLGVDATLSSEDKALFAARTCSGIGPLGHVEVTGTPIAIGGGLAGRTGVLLVATDFTGQSDFATCFASVPDGGTPPNCTLGDGGVGVPLYEQGTLQMDVSQALQVMCIACRNTWVPSASGRIIISGMETRCSP